MLLGKNEHLSELGRPLQERAIGVEDVPDFIAAVTRTVPTPPSAETVTALGEAPNEITVGDGVEVGCVGGGAGGGVVTVEGQLGT